MTKLDDLRALARADLEAKRGLLDWSWRHAEALGELSAAEAELRRLDDRDHSWRETMMRTYPSEEQMQAIFSLQVAEAELRRAREQVASATARVRFCEHVIALLGRLHRAPKIVPLPNRQQHPNKKAS